MKLGLVDPQWQEMLGELLVSSYQALPLLSSLSVLWVTPQGPHSCLFSPLFLEVFVDKDGFPELDTENQVIWIECQLRVILGMFFNFEPHYKADKHKPFCEE